MDVKLSPKIVSLEYMENTTMTGLDLLMEGVQDKICEHKKIQKWLPMIIQFFITDINLSDAHQLNQDEKDYVNFVNIILKHLK